MAMLQEHDFVSIAPLYQFDYNVKQVLKGEYFSLEKLRSSLRRPDETVEEREWCDTLELAPN